MTELRGGWHLDKRVPIAIIAAFVLQTFVIGTIVGVLFQRVTHNEATSALAPDNRTRISVVEASLASMAMGQVRIENKLDRLIERALAASAASTLEKKRTAIP